jgi:hypothetical protein
MIPYPSKQTKAAWYRLACLAFMIAGSLFAFPAFADDKSGPWECSNYSGDAHTRCLQAFIEIQREKISKLEAEIQLQQGKMGQLKDQVDRQASATADLQRQLSEQPPVNYSYVTPGAGLYLYPPVGLGLYFGRPWVYGPPYYSRPLFWGPRYYRPYFGRWHRRW